MKYAFLYINIQGLIELRHQHMQICGADLVCTQTEYSNNYNHLRNEIKQDFQCCPMH